ncbi:hypothetical protein TNCV_1206001 [Trichonephila clavipes]|nr:hypothetical protein TNCV_1206001 [Trichonephila clavipes]
MRICDRWMQEGRMDRCGQSHPPQCTTSHEDRTTDVTTANGATKEGFMWMAEWNEVVFTDESRNCLQHHDGRIRVWRHHRERMLNNCVMHRHTGIAPGIMGLATAIFQQDNARPHVARIVQRFIVNHQIELLPWLARSPEFSPIENMCPWLLND